MKKSFIFVTVLALLVMLAPGCVPEVAPAPTPPAPAPTPKPMPTPEPAPTVEWGIIEVRVTDPPPADVKSAVVYLTNIEVHRVAGEQGEWIMISEFPPSFDLMVVAEEGIEEILGSENVTAGKFTQIRMEVEKVEVVIATGDNVTTEITAEVPSGKLKIVRPFNVEGGAKTVLTLDFDGEKSLILPGKDVATGKARALFKPVVKLLIEKGEMEKEREREREEGRLNLELEGDAAPGETVTLLVTVTFDGETVEGAQVKVNGEDMGLTDESGTISFTITIPEDADELEIEAKLNELEGELEIEFEEE